MIGIIAIGRNEGDRLKTCLAAASTRRDAVIVYVDSNSSDNSVELARSFNAHVVELDMSKPFSAACARNEGFAKLIEVAPDVEFVQFLDGDCELQPTWIDTALAAFRDLPKAAVICGRRRERHPDASIYNRLCDIEWNTPVGKALACGGDALVRVSAFKEVGGYNPAVIAGEEPEMCVRLRAKGWEIHRIDAEMTLHDAAMTRFGQWWKRNVRSGHAYAEGAFMHGAPPERHWVKEVRSNWVWGLLIPISGFGLLLFPLQMWRIQRRLGRDLPPGSAGYYAFFVVLGKIPQMLGQSRFHWNRLTGTKARIIEYKGARLEGGPA